MIYYKSKTGDVYAYSKEDLKQVKNLTKDTPQVFHAIAEKLEGMVELKGKELDLHLNPAPTTEQLAHAARAKRDSLLSDLETRLLRYERQERLGIETNDTGDWYLAALQCAQDLRDVPQQKGFPKTVVWPQCP